MTVLEQFTATGDLFFRWRSYLPLLLLPLFIASLVSGHGHLTPVWEASCFVVSLLGLCIRAVVVGTAPRGTSERGTRRPTADSLNTTGAYSVVRHPLYVANTLIVLGLSLFSATWFLPVIVALASLLYYERIAAREEAFLLEKFGSEFTLWARRVPAMVPNFSRYRPPAAGFNLKRVLIQECHGLFVISAGFFLLDTLKNALDTHTFSIDRYWLLVFVSTGLLFATAVFAKKRAAESPAVS